MPRFAEMWLQNEPPKAGFTARSHTLIGTLVINGDHDVYFETKDGHSISLVPLSEISIGRRGTDFFNRWIELRYGIRGHERVSYLKDGGSRGWRPILTRTHRGIIEALREAMAESAS